MEHKNGQVSLLGLIHDYKDYGYTIQSLSNNTLSFNDEYGLGDTPIYNNEKLFAAYRLVPYHKVFLWCYISDKAELKEQLLAIVNKHTLSLVEELIGEIKNYK